MNDPLSQLTSALRCLPGVGPKSAQRMVYHLLQHRRKEALFLASCLEEAMQRVGHCESCNNYSTESLCLLCLDVRRDSRQICVVESPADVLAIEQSQVYQGRYFVLMHALSPLDGIGPEEIALPKFLRQLQALEVEEVILALSPSVEGQTTIHFIENCLAEYRVRVSKLARGIPSGAELGYLDSHTISAALLNRA